MHSVCNEQNTISYWGQTLVGQLGFLDPDNCQEYNQKQRMALRIKTGIDLYQNIERVETHSGHQENPFPFSW